MYEGHRAVQAAVNGEALFSPAIAKRLIRFMAVARAELPKPVFPELTEREREILGMIAQGRSNAEIAEQLVVSVKTVQNHATTIFEKSQVADRAQAALRAREAGLGQT
jgi:DNA-binding NarL/FixJ family response regulator